MSLNQLFFLKNKFFPCKTFFLNFRDSGVIKINTTRQTRFKEIRKSCEFPVRKLTDLNNIPPKNPVPFNEIDLVGVIVSIKNLTTFPESPQIVYLSDLNFNFVGLYFGGGCKVK